jgi:transposase
MRYELGDYEWTAIKPMLPNKPRGVRRVNDHRVLNGIFWVLRSDAPWRDLPENYGPRALVTLHPRQLIGVEIGITEQFLAHPRAFHEEADVELVGHSHAAMHLHAFLHRLCRG